MSKYYSITLKTISIITLTAFIATKCGLGYASDSTLRQMQMINGAAVASSSGQNVEFDQVFPIENRYSSLKAIGRADFTMKPWLREIIVQMKNAVNGHGNEILSNGQPLYNITIEAIANSIDAVFDAIDNNELAEEDALIHVRFNFDSRTGKFYFSVSDNGMGITKSKMSSFEAQERSSSKPDFEESLFIGWAGKGVVVSSMSRAIQNGYAIRIQACHKEDGGKEFVLAADGKKQVNELPDLKDIGTTFIVEGTVSVVSVPAAGAAEGRDIPSGQNLLKAAREGQGPAAAQADAKGGINRILLVDDDTDTLDLMERMVKAWNPKVYVAKATDRDTALRLLKDEGPFDAAIIDYVLGAYGGYGDEIVEVINPQTREKTTPVFILSDGARYRLEPRLAPLKSSGQLIDYRDGKRDVVNDFERFKALLDELDKVLDEGKAAGEAPAAGRGEAEAIPQSSDAAAGGLKSMLPQPIAAERAIDMRSVPENASAEENQDSASANVVSVASAGGANDEIRRGLIGIKEIEEEFGKERVEEFLYRLHSLLRDTDNFTKNYPPQRELWVWIIGALRVFILIINRILTADFRPETEPFISATSFRSVRQIMAKINQINAEYGGEDNKYFGIMADPVRGPNGRIDLNILFYVAKAESEEDIWKLENGVWADIHRIKGFETYSFRPKITTEPEIKWDQRKKTKIRCPNRHFISVGGKEYPNETGDDGPGSLACFFVCRALKGEGALSLSDQATSAESITPGVVSTDAARGARQGLGEAQAAGTAKRIWRWAELTLKEKKGTITAEEKVELAGLAAPVWGKDLTPQVYSFLVEPIKERNRPQGYTVENLEILLLISSTSILNKIAAEQTQVLSDYRDVIERLIALDIQYTINPADIPVQERISRTEEKREKIVEGKTQDLGLVEAISLVFLEINLAWWKDCVFYGREHDQEILITDILWKIDGSLARFLNKYYPEMYDKAIKELIERTDTYRGYISAAGQGLSSEAKPHQSTKDAKEEPAQAQDDANGQASGTGDSFNLPNLTRLESDTYVHAAGQGQGEADANSLSDLSDAKKVVIGDVIHLTGNRSFEVEKVVKITGGDYFTRSLLIIAKDLNSGETVVLSSKVKSRREWELGKDLNHKNIVKMRELLEDAAGNPVIVMDYVQWPQATLHDLDIVGPDLGVGYNFDEYIRKRGEPESKEDWLEIIPKVIMIGEALLYMKDKGLIPSPADFRPGDIMMTPEDEPVLGDMETYDNAKGDSSDDYWLIESIKAVLQALLGGERYKSSRLTLNHLERCNAPKALIPVLMSINTDTPYEDRCYLLSEFIAALRKFMEESKKDSIAEDSAPAAGAAAGQAQADAKGAGTIVVLTQDWQGLKPETIRNIKSLIGIWDGGKIEGTSPEEEKLHDRLSYLKRRQGIISSDPDDMNELQEEILVIETELLGIYGDPVVFDEGVALQQQIAAVEMALIRAYIETERDAIDRYDWSQATDEDYERAWFAPDVAQIAVSWPSQMIEDAFRHYHDETDPDYGDLAWLREELEKILGGYKILSDASEKRLCGIGSKGKIFVWQGLNSIYDRDPYCIFILNGIDIGMPRFYWERNGKRYIAWVHDRLGRIFCTSHMNGENDICHEAGHIRFDKLRVETQESFVDFVNRRLASCRWTRVHAILGEEPEHRDVETDGLRLYEGDIKKERVVRELFAIFYGDWILGKDFRRPLLAAHYGGLQEISRVDPEVREALVREESAKIQEWFDWNFGVAAAVGTDTELLQAVREKFSMLAAVVIDSDEDNRGRIKNNLKAYWEFDKVLAVEKAADLEAILKTDEYRDVKFILVINNNKDDLSGIIISMHGFLPIEIPADKDPTVAIREFLDSV